MFTLAMQVDKDKSLTSLYEFEQQEGHRKKQRIIRTISQGEDTGLIGESGVSFDQTG